LERSRRRIALIATLLAGAIASCSVTRLNEADVRNEAAPQLDCEPGLLKLESVGGPRDGVARYIVRGCGQTRTLDCVEERSQVHCRTAYGGGGSGDESSPASDAAVATAVAATGCACASLFAHHRDASSAPASTSPPPVSTTPQRNR